MPNPYHPTQGCDKWLSSTCWPSSRSWNLRNSSMRYLCGRFRWLLDVRFLFYFPSWQLERFISLDLTRNLVKLTHVTISDNDFVLLENQNSVSTCFGLFQVELIKRSVYNINLRYPHRRWEKRCFVRLSICEHKLRTVWNSVGLINEPITCGWPVINSAPNIYRCILL